MGRLGISFLSNFRFWIWETMNRIFLICVGLWGYFQQADGKFVLYLLTEDNCNYFNFKDNRFLIYGKLIFHYLEQSTQIKSSHRDKNYVYKIEWISGVLCNHTFYNTNFIQCYNTNFLYRESTFTRTDIYKKVYVDTQGFS